MEDQKQQSSNLIRNSKTIEKQHERKNQTPEKKASAAASKRVAYSRVLLRKELL